MLCCRAPFLMRKQMNFSKNDAVHRIISVGDIFRSANAKPVSMQISYAIAHDNAGKK